MFISPIMQHKHKKLKLKYKDDSLNGIRTACFFLAKIHFHNIRQNVSHEKKQNL